MSSPRGTAVRRPRSRTAAVVARAGRAALFLAAAGLWYVLSGVAHAPRLVAYRWIEPRGTALTRLRAEEGIEPRAAPGWVPLRGVPHSLANAVLHAEDDGFATHEGFDLPRLRLAARGALEDRRLSEGASTISQQLVKNLFLSPARNPLRKLKEAALTMVLEAAVPKPRILELYLNVIEWGPGIYGIGPASRTYFGKPPSRLAPAASAPPLSVASVLSPPGRRASER